MENLQMNISSFNSGEVVQLLLKALKISNDKCQLWSNTGTKLQNQTHEIELDKTKSVLEKDNVIGALNSKIDLLNNELKEKEKSLSDLVEMQSATIEELGKKQREALSEKESVMSQKDKELAAVRSESAEKDKTIDKLSNNLTSIQKEFEQFKIDSFKSSFLQYLGELKIEEGLLNADDFCGLKHYINNMENSTRIFSQDYDTVESFFRALLSPDGLISSVCNLIWWLDNELIKKTYIESNEIFKHIVCFSKAILDTFMKFGYAITLPPSKFCSELDDYSLYDNDNSHIKDIFPKVIFEKYVLCEIYTVSYNKNKGKCYSL